MTSTTASPGGTVPSFRKPSAGGGSSSVAFKEKVVQMYEVLLRGEDPVTSFGPNFWCDFFLLKPKVMVMEAETAKLTAEQLLNARPNLNRFSLFQLSTTVCRNQFLSQGVSLHLQCPCVLVILTIPNDEKVVRSRTLASRHRVNLKVRQLRAHDQTNQ